MIINNNNNVMVPLSHPLSMSVEWLGMERRKSDYDGGRSTQCGRDESSATRG